MSGDFNLLCARNWITLIWPEGTFIQDVVTGLRGDEWTCTNNILPLFRLHQSQIKNSRITISKETLRPIVEFFIVSIPLLYYSLTFLSYYEWRSVSVSISPRPTLSLPSNEEEELDFNPCRPASLVSSSKSAWFFARRDKASGKFLAHLWSMWRISRYSLSSQRQQLQPRDGKGVMQRTSKWY